MYRVIQKNSTLQIIQQILEAAVQEMSDFMWTIIIALLADLIQRSIQSLVGSGQHTVRVHLHHDHRDSLVADPDDPGASLSLSSLLIGRGSLWGVGLSLTCLLSLVGRLDGRGLSLHAASHCGTQVHLLKQIQAESVLYRRCAAICSTKLVKSVNLRYGMATWRTLLEKKSSKTKASGWEGSQTRKSQNTILNIKLRLVFLAWNPSLKLHKSLFLNLNKNLNLKKDTATLNSSCYVCCPLVVVVYVKSPRILPWM